jgi:hypothetical protein
MWAHPSRGDKGLLVHQGVGYYLVSNGLSHAQWSSSKGWYEAYK